MNPLIEYRIETPDKLKVEFDVISPVTTSEDSRKFIKKQIEQGLNNIDSQIAANEKILDDMSSEIEQLTNNADGIDYTIAVASGIISGLIDSFFIGEFSLDKGTQWGKEKVDSFVMYVAKERGNKENSLAGAVKFLEKNFPIPADSATSIFGGGTQHHLRDFSHHPNPLGLVFSLLTQFTGKVFGTNTWGKFIVEEVPDRELIGKDLTSKLAIGFTHWIFHMVSDIAASSGSIVKGKYGTGLPGPFISLLKEVSTLPFFSHQENNNKFCIWISKLFNGTLLSKKDEYGKIIPDSLIKFDLRAELGILHELGKQAIPIIINECIVRISYFVRRLVMEFKNNEINTFHDFVHTINWKTTLPFNNRTITRMMTIASGTFVAVDLADAAVRSGLKSGGGPTVFLTNMVLRVNFVGIGRFAVAIYSDLKMGNQKENVQKERWYKNSEQIFLYNAKVFYKETDMWIAAEDASKALLEMEKCAIKSVEFFCDSLITINEDLMKISGSMYNAEHNNPGILEDLSKILKY